MLWSLCHHVPAPLSYHSPSLSSPLLSCHSPSFSSPLLISFPSLPFPLLSSSHSLLSPLLSSHSSSPFLSSFPSHFPLLSSHSPLLSSPHSPFCSLLSPLLSSLFVCVCVPLASPWHQYPEAGHRQNADERKPAYLSACRPVPGECPSTRCITDPMHQVKLRLFPHVC